jgi:acetyltransferase
MGESLRQFPGTVHHINKLRPDPDNGVYATVAEAAASTGAVPDLAVMCVPAAVTVDAVRDAALAGTQLAIVCAGGFAESGVNGALMQQELSHVCSETGIRVLGPNTSGVIVPPAGLIASFVPGLDVVREGPVAVIAASGGVNHALTFALSNRNIGIRVAVGLGNAVDIDMADVLEALADDAETGLIALHIESIGDGRRLVEAVARVVDRIPVIASVIGRADVAEFAKSHTGALAAPWRTTRAALRHAGAVIVDDERELIEAITALSLLRVERRSAPPGVAIVTGQAGPGLLLTDAIRNHKVSVPSLSASTVESLKRDLPDLTFQQNPVDTGRPGSSFADVIRTVSSDESIDLTVVFALLEPDVIDLPSVLESLGSETSSVIAVVGGPKPGIEEAHRRLVGSGIPCYDSPAAAAIGVRALIEDVNRPSWLVPANRNRRDRPELLSASGFDEFEAKHLLGSIGIAVPDGVACDSDSQVREHFSRMSSPAVLKVLDAKILHKTEIGGVVLSIVTVEELDAAIEQLQAIGATRFLLEEMAPPGVDVLVAARRDPLFGPMVTLAMGGTYAELFDDVAIRLAPLNVADAESMLSELRLGPLLGGWRGTSPLELERLWRIICELGDLLMDQPNINEIEINPLRVGVGEQPLALDALVLVKDSSQ